MPTAKCYFFRQLKGVCSSHTRRLKEKKIPHFIQQLLWVAITGMLIKISLFGLNFYLFFLCLGSSLLFGLNFNLARICRHFSFSSLLSFALFDFVSFFLFLAFGCTSTHTKQRPNESTKKKENLVEMRIIFCCFNDCLELISSSSRITLRAMAVQQ